MRFHCLSILGANNYSWLSAKGVHVAAKIEAKVFVHANAF